MNIQDLAKERIIGNIKMGTKGDKGPKKLPYFNVEEDKATSKQMVDIFKQLYHEKVTKLLIMFTSESPFSVKYKRYINNKPVCIGDDRKAITIGKDNKGNNTKVEIECNESCQQRMDKKCRLVGSLKFKLVGIEANGLWKINTTGEISICNIASEIMEYKKAGISLVGKVFELTLSQQESFAYGPYYSLNLQGQDIKPQLTEGRQEAKITSKQKNKQLPEVVEERENTEKEKKKEVEIVEEIKENQVEEDNSNYLIVKKIIPTLINNMKFNKIIFQDTTSQEVELVLHPKANQELLECMPGTVIKLISSKVESGRNILCKYNIEEKVNFDINVEESQIKEAV